MAFGPSESKTTWFVLSGRKVVAPSAVPPVFGGVPLSHRRSLLAVNRGRSIGAAL